MDISQLPIVKCARSILFSNEFDTVFVWSVVWSLAHFKCQNSKKPTQIIAQITQLSLSIPSISIQIKLDSVIKLSDQ